MTTTNHLYDRYLITHARVKSGARLAENDYSYYDVLETERKPFSREYLITIALAVEDAKGKSPIKTVGEFMHEFERLAERPMELEMTPTTRIAKKAA